tara:strand:- start:954 stop:1418 length:465 start_codon:yes stop_codon:yes gene_type:complete
LVSHTLNKKQIRRSQKKKLSKSFSNSFFTSKQVQRKFPVQAALHTILDGALVGVLVTVAIMSSVALHSQYLWTEAFTKLTKTRDLNKRILESTSILESYLLKNQKLSRSLVPTKAEDLIYVNKPSQQNTQSLYKKTLKRKLFEKVVSFPLKSGY